MTSSTCFDVFEQCVLAIQAGELIESLNPKDKEFHFQNWFLKRLNQLALHFDSSGRNKYPDFCLLEYAEDYDIKGLAFFCRHEKGRMGLIGPMRPMGY